MALSPLAEALALEQAFYHLTSRLLQEEVAVTLLLSPQALGTSYSLQVPGGGLSVTPGGRGTYALHERGPSAYGWTTTAGLSHGQVLARVTAWQEAFLGQRAQEEAQEGSLQAFYEEELARACAAHEEDLRAGAVVQGESPWGEEEESWLEAFASLEASRGRRKL